MVKFNSPSNNWAQLYSLHNNRICSNHSKIEDGIELLYFTRLFAVYRKNNRIMEAGSPRETICKREGRLTKLELLGFKKVLDTAMRVIYFLRIKLYLLI